jgi:hypothetical protein
MLKTKILNFVLHCRRAQKLDEHESNDRDVTSKSLARAIDSMKRDRLIAAKLKIKHQVN